MTEVPLCDRSTEIAVIARSAAKPVRLLLAASARVKRSPGTSKRTRLVTLRFRTNAEILVTSPCSIFIFLGVMSNSWTT
jgi:hypothetical protein